MDKVSAIVIAIIGFVCIVAYSNHTDESVLFFGFFLALAFLVLPKLLDLLRDWVQHRPAAVQKESDPQLRERLEHLEALMCRLDAEINTQMERSLSSGKIITTANEGNSHMPTTFMNVASILEDRYQVLRELGRGGMGIVFQAYDRKLNEQVAIKILSPILSTNSDALERLQREVSAARKITHSNVIRIHDIAEAKGLHYVSMEYFEGSSLKDYIRREGIPSQMQAGTIALQICEGLEAAHRQGIIHRDLKSQNIIINALHQIKIIDFGLARTAHLDGMTATGLIMGTPEYMSPEQVSGKKVDERSDVYSVGIILYELFTGNVPFTGESAIAVGFKQLKENPTVPTQANPQITPGIEKVILKALQKDPLQRYRSVVDLKADLETALQMHAPVASSPVAATQQSERIKQ